MVDLTRDEIEYLRFLRRHANDLYRFPVQIVSDQHASLEFRSLIERGYVAEVNGNAFMVITPKGLEALHAAFLADEQAQEAEHQRQQELARQQRRDQEAVLAQQAHLDQQTKQQFKHDWLLAVFNLAGGFLLGLVAEHFADILGKISAAFAAMGELLH